MEPDQCILYCHSRIPGSHGIERECPAYIRMPDIFSLVLSPTYIMYYGLTGPPLAVKTRVLWHQKPPRVENRSTADLTERMVDAHGVVIHDIGDLGDSEPIEQVSWLRQIFQDCIK